MNWDAIGAIGQILGSAGVLISIAYLAVQVGHARDAVARSTRQARADNNIRLLLARATGESSRRAMKTNLALGGEPNAFVAAMIEHGVTADDAQAEFYEQLAGWSAREHSIQNVDQLNAGERASFAASARYYYGTQPVSRLWYEKAKASNSLNPDAVRYVDALLAHTR